MANGNPIGSQLELEFVHSRQENFHPLYPLAIGQGSVKVSFQQPLFFEWGHPSSLLGIGHKQNSENKGWA